MLSVNPNIPGFVFKKCLMQTLYCALWRAHQAALERDVLILVFNEYAKGDTAILDTCMRVVQAMVDIRVPLFPDVIDIIRTEQDAYVILEDPKAVAILKELEGRTLDSAQAIRLLLAMTEGFSRLERLHLVYSCVRPKNLYLTEEHTPLLPDISLIRFEPGAGYNPPIEFSEGMASYLAPEQYSDDMEIQDARTEMYSLAMTIYALTTGQVPYGALPAQEILTTKLVQSLPSPQDIVKGFDANLTQILMRMAQRDPDDRYPDWDAVRFDLFQLMAGVEIVCPKPEGSTLAPPTGTRSRMRSRAHRFSSRREDFVRKSLTLMHVFMVILLVLLIGLLIAVLVWGIIYR